MINFNFDTLFSCCSFLDCYDLFFTAFFNWLTKRNLCLSIFRRVDHADEIMAAGLNFSVELVPGHTSGQVVYRLHVSPDSPDCLFTGDFLFVGGTGDYCLPLDPSSLAV